MKEVQVLKGDIGRVRRDKSKLIERTRVGVYVRVSTDSEEQLLSYNSQVAHYKQLVQSNSEWELVKIYADEAISGTQIAKRMDFQNMISDAVKGKLDLVITKSISRFARNTLDTLNYVRLLKEKNVAIFFEKENINTLTMNGEMLLVILSSLAQQESESISANVKMGLKMKMKRGELVGFHGCLGYDYDLVQKTISINEEEAKIIRHIFEKYLEGFGCYVIAKDLTNLGFKTKKGNAKWHESSIRLILKNEKYKGDILLGKTFTVDPLTHRRLENFGEEDKYYISNNHEPIIDAEKFDKVQEIMDKRGRQKHVSKGDRREYKRRKYAFSGKVKCDFCGKAYSRRSWHGSSNNRITVWGCITSTKKGKRFCSNSKQIKEEVLKETFVEAFNMLCGKHQEVIKKYIADMEKAYRDDNSKIELDQTESAIRGIKYNINKLIDMNIEGLIDKGVFQHRQRKEDEKLKRLKVKLHEIQDFDGLQLAMKKRLKMLKKIMSSKSMLMKFDREIFENVTKDVIIGRTENNGEANSYAITFVFRTGNRGAKASSGKDKLLDGNIEDTLYSQPLHDTCGVCLQTC